MLHNTHQYERKSDIGKKTTHFARNYRFLNIKYGFTFEYAEIQSTDKRTEIQEHFDIALDSVDEILNRNAHA